MIEKKRVLDSYSGNLFSSNGFLFVDIKAPIRQYFIIQDSKTILYYPDEKRGISLLNNSFPVIPFYHALLAFALEDFGLSEQGHTLDSTVVDSTEKIITAYWSPQENLLKHSQKTAITIKNNIIIKVESFDSLGNVFSAINFSKFITLQNHLLPTKIVFEEINTRKTLIQEEIIFTEVLINEPLPEKIVDFRLPDDVDIKEVEW